MSHLTGYKQSEMLGRKTYQVFYPIELRKKNPEIEDEYKKYLGYMEDLYLRRMQGISEIYTAKIFRKDGSLRLSEVRGAPLKSKTGEIMGSVGFYVDITDKHLEDEKTYFGHRMDILQNSFSLISESLANCLYDIGEGISKLERASNPNESLTKSLKDSWSKATNVENQLLMLCGGTESVNSCKEISLRDFYLNNEELIRANLGKNKEVISKLDDKLPNVVATENIVLTVLLFLAARSENSETFHLWSELYTEEKTQEAESRGLKEGNYLLLGARYTNDSKQGYTFNRISETAASLDSMLAQVGGHVVEELTNKESRLVQIYLPIAENHGNSDSVEDDSSIGPFADNNSANDVSKQL